MNKVVLLFCKILFLCIVASCNGADDSNPKTPTEVGSKKPTVPPHVTQACKNTPYPGLCSLMIGTDPDAKNADLTRLTLISIRTSTFSAIENVQLVADMEKEESVKGDEEVLKCYKNCSECYSGVVEAFDDSLVELMKKNYVGVKEKIHGAEVYKETCQKCFATTKHKDAKDTMSALNEMLGKLCKIAVSLVDALKKAKP